MERRNEGDVWQTASCTHTTKRTSNPQREKGERKAKNTNAQSQANEDESSKTQVEKEWYKTNN